MMRLFALLLCLLAAVITPACDSAQDRPKIGVSMGVGPATRWLKEQSFMEERARELNIDLEVRRNLTDSPKTQTEDCLDMIASGIKVLILVPRDVRKTDAILAYARQHGVKVVSYGRAVMGGTVDLYVGYDSYKIGQSMGLHLVEKVFRGDLLVLKGDANDFNSSLIYFGAMKHLRPLIDSGDFNLLLDEFVPNWSPERAKQMVKSVVAANGNHVDAIFAPNDKLAGASAEALKELNISAPVIITGMDAELDAARRIVAGTQDATVFMDLKDLARAAVDEAYHMAINKKVTTNSRFENESSSKIDAFLINGKMVTRENLDKVLIESGYYSREQIYGQQAP